MATREKTMKPFIPYPVVPSTHTRKSGSWHRSIERFDWLVAIVVYLVAFVLLVMACVHDLSTDRHPRSLATPAAALHAEAEHVTIAD
jgi:hypothetical protein